MLLSSYPQAIVHIDADAFFASVEQALHPELKGRPLITGAERGMVIALSYEAKAKGIKRGMLVSEAKRLCPGLVAKPSNYETYCLFSKRIFEIMRRFTPQVEEYSIDEAFADISGLRRLYRCSYQQIAKRMKDEIEKDLGITVSVGLSLTKGLAKLASKFQKPSGLVCVPGRDLEIFLKPMPIENVWGFGKNSVALLKKNGVNTVLDFIHKPEYFAKKILGKIGVEIWQELSGTLVSPVSSLEKTTYASISKFLTFSPPSSDREHVFARLVRNLENAIAKMRRFHLATRRVWITLKSQDFKIKSLEITLSRFTSNILEIIHAVKEGFDKLFEPQALYRTTGVILSNLKEDQKIQLSIFEDPAHVLKTEHVSQAMDVINSEYGRNQIHLADSLPIQNLKKTKERNLKIPLWEIK